MATVDGFLTVERLLWCSPIIESSDQTFDLANLPPNYSRNKHNCQCIDAVVVRPNIPNSHFFYGQYITDIKLSGMSNVSRVEFCHMTTKDWDVTGTFASYTVGVDFDMPDFVGLRAVGAGLWIKFLKVNEHEPMSGTLKYRHLRPLRFMEPIESDTLFCQRADSSIMACYRNRIFTYNTKSFKSLSVYANVSFKSDKKMYKFPVCEFTVETDELEKFRVPWITFMSHTQTTATLSIKSEHIGQFEQLAVQTCSKWRRTNEGVLDEELTAKVNQAIEAEYKKAVDWYNTEKTTAPVLMQWNEIPRDVYDEYETQAARYKKILARADQQRPGYEGENVRDAANDPAGNRSILYMLT
jgi:hypothetical protein